MVLLVDANPRPEAAGSTVVPENGLALCLGGQPTIADAKDGSVKVKIWVVSGSTSKKQGAGARIPGSTGSVLH